MNDLPVKLARHAMATRFEILLPEGDSRVRRSAGEEALNEIERLEERLSLFRATSEIANINRQAAIRPVQVSPEVFSLLLRCKETNEATVGAFDISIAPLMKCWGFMGGHGHLPDAEALVEARACSGMRLVDFNSEERTVRFKRPGVMLDLGAIGKGYAIELAAEILRDAGVTSALLHGGTSTVYGLGHPPGGEGWPVQIDFRADPPIPPVLLKDEALSVSAVQGKYFEQGGNALGHILDPRTGAPARNALLTAVVQASATDTDALSTALLVAGPTAQRQITSLRPAMRTVVVDPHQNITFGGFE